MEATLELLGTGSSNGVPQVGCDCERCRSTDPRDKRSRTSAFIKFNDKSILIDCSPELHDQAVNYNIMSIDAVLITHVHADHVFGIDDLRSYSRTKKIPMYSTQEFIDEIRQCFSYIFTQSSQIGGGKPTLELEPIKGTFDCLDIKVTAVPIIHGAIDIVGYRFNSFAYITDCSKIPEESYELLKGIDTLFINAIGSIPHHSHMSIYQTLDEIEKIGGIKRAFIIHISHQCSHMELEAIVKDEIAKRPKLKDTTVTIGYDGLVLDGLFV
ncbi:MBL fold metallo-hydrolase [Histomonas meleagridis]|uniref:MBL fold metallo-hydrolase n=1 Tax=Histomonas meleagridis TaxID=135588 RepID=UPI00355A2005|nr:MBL fold metallo-hydrolase [Histomonas meleagridis]KAH0803067.1 MBL fold metallo-hydrolase [Histomonas meleagridis]